LRVLEQEHLIKPSSHGAVAGENTEKFLEDFDGQISDIIAKASHIQQIRNSI
jgi:predicted transcriptional regulator